MKQRESRKWSLITYLPLADVAAVFADKADKVRAYAYALHDKDVNKDGTPKVPHVHVIVWLNTSYYESTIKNWFRGYDDKNELVNTLAEPTKDINTMYRYLTHKDDPDKYQYDEDIVVCSDPSCFEDEVRTDDTWQAVDDLLAGVPLREVAKRYGRDFIYHYSHIRGLVDDIKAEEHRRAERER